MSKPSNAIRDFWDWFAENANEIRATGAEQVRDGIAPELGTRLKKCHPELVWEIAAESDEWELCISANGDREVFPAVIEVTEAAPTIPGWSILAFRQRGKLDVRLEFDEHTLSYDDIWFTANRNGNELSVTLWIKGLTQENDRALSQAALILLDNALGEYDAVMHIAELNRGPLPKNPETRPGLHPLSQLPEMVDFIKDK